MATQSESNEQEKSAEQQHILSDSELEALKNQAAKEALDSYQNSLERVYTAEQWEEEEKGLRRSYRRELYGELREKKEKEEEKVRRMVHVELAHDGRTTIHIKGISGMRRGEANRMGVLIGKTLLAARGHSRRTGEEEYTHVW